MIWIWDLTAIDASMPDASLRPAPVKSRLTGHDGRIWSLADIPAGPGRPPRWAFRSTLYSSNPPDPASVERTGAAATVTIGLGTGILALDLHRDLFQSAPRRTARPPTAARRSSL